MDSELEIGGGNYGEYFPCSLLVRQAPATGRIQETQQRSQVSRPRVEPFTSWKQGTYIIVRQIWWPPKLNPGVFLHQSEKVLQWRKNGAIRWIKNSIKSLEFAVRNCFTRQGDLNPHNKNNVWTVWRVTLSKEALFERWHGMACLG
jgi:hypothetical protein